MTPLAAFIEFLYGVFVLLLELTIDLICLCFLLGACAQPWRLPKVLRGACSSGWFDSREAYRETCLAQFFLGIADVVTGAVWIVTLFSGLRTFTLCKKTCSSKEDSESYRATQFAAVWASITWSQFGNLLLDVIPFGFLLAYFSMPWRWPAMFRGLTRHGSGWLFRTLCPCCTETKTSSSAPGDSETRSRWMTQALFGLIDAVTFVPYVLVMVTGLRSRKLCRKLRDAARDYDEEVEFNMSKVAVVWVQCTLQGFEPCTGR